MSQKTITAFFNSRKRAATEDIFSTKNKRVHKDRVSVSECAVKCEVKVENIEASSPNHTASEAISRNKKSLQNEPSSNNPGKDKSNKEVFAKKVNIDRTKDKADLLNLARKELSLGDIRKKLAGSSRLAEIKARAEKLSQGIKELKNESDQRNLKEFKTLNVDVPASPSKKSLVPNDLYSPSKNDKNESTDQTLLMSPRKVFVSPVKSPSKVPAYIKHAALASASTSLPLPHQYRFLAELFRGMETVVSLLYNRNEKITFNKLKPSVQEMLKRNFTEKHLAQIKHLVPDFYNFEVQKIKNFSTSSQKEGYELIVTPNFPNDIKNMNPTVLLERRRYFYDTLLQLVKKHHNQYLQTLDPPMVIPDDKLTRWHPEFELEKVPEVDVAKLPEIPDTEKYSTAQDVLAKARELFKCNTKMERALEKLAQAKTRGLTPLEKEVTGIKTENPTTNGCPSSSYTIMNPALRNLPAALLEKVKAKQAAKALEAMTRSTDYDKKYLVYVRLPDLARTLRNIFVTERKNVLALNIILSKLDSSFKASVSANNLISDIKVLAEEIPDWVKLHEIRNTSYLKLDKSADLNNIISKLDALAEKYKP